MAPHRGNGVEVGHAEREPARGDVRPPVRHEKAAEPKAAAPWLTTDGYTFVHADGRVQR